jgi:hypothetical protein
MELRCAVPAGGDLRTNVKSHEEVWNNRISMHGAKLATACLPVQ